MNLQFKHVLFLWSEGSRRGPFSSWNTVSKMSVHVYVYVCILYYFKHQRVSGKTIFLFHRSLCISFKSFYYSRVSTLWIGIWYFAKRLLCPSQLLKYYRTIQTRRVVNACCKTYSACTRLELE